MKKSHLLIAFCLGVVLNATAQSSVSKLPKLSPLTRVLLRDIAERPIKATDEPDGYIHKIINGQTYLSGLIKVADEKSITPKLDDMGVIVGTKAGDIWTVQVPYIKAMEFAATTGISYIQLDEPLRPSLDIARKATRVDSVHMGIGLPWPMSGMDVVVGVIDFGFDYGHPAFYDKNGTNYRVKKVWELATAGTPPTGYSYGHELTTPSSIIAQGTDNSVQTHGTGVAGISSGSGFGTTDFKLKGIAYNSDLVFVGVRRDEIGNQWRQSSFSDFLDGVKYIFDYAGSVKKTAVTNISWGSQSGPHDGTSLFAQACDNLSGQGKVIVMSAGNDGQENIHIAKTFTPTDTIVNTFATFSADNMKRTWIDVWGDTAKTFCAKVTLYSKNGTAGNTTGFICIDDQIHNTYLISNNGLDTCFIDFISSSSEFNDKPRMTLDIYNKSGDSILISVKGKDGSIDMWNEYYYYGYTYRYTSVFESLNLPGAVNGNTESTVSDMGSARSVILVGAYTSKESWRDINNRRVSSGFGSRTGEIAPFSSRGPMADGRIKPDITAPGISIATSISSFSSEYTPSGGNSQFVVASTNFNSKTYYFAEFSGTSASAPVTSGIVALMLEANPRLTPQQVNDILAQTAIKDNFTGALPAAGNNTWGKGKINAFGAVKAANQTNGVYEFKGRKLDCIIFPNPATNGQFSLHYTSAQQDQLSVKVYDITGRIVLSEYKKAETGDNMYTFSMPKASAGNYIVHISNAQGSVDVKLQLK